MKRTTSVCLFLIAITTVAAQQTVVVNPRCEYKTNPIGIDIVKPGLSWELQSSQKNVLQTAYRILVADDSALLKKNIGNYWDSKKISTASSIQVAYKGKTLQATKTYYWKVMIWDNKAAPGAWSSIANWQMGLLNKADWKNAKWIGYEAIADSSIILPFAHGKGKKEWGARKDILPLLRRTFSVYKKLRKATMFISGLGHFEMSINGQKTGDHFLDPGWTMYSKHALYVAFNVTGQLHQGSNTIGVMLGNGFYYIPGERYRKLTGAFGYPKMICRLVIDYADGSSSSVSSNEYWKTAPSPISFSSIYGGEDYDATLEQPGWNTPSFDDSRWKEAVATDGPVELNSQLAEPLKVMQEFLPISKTLLKPGVTLYDLGQNFSGIPAITVNGKKGDTVRIIPAELINDDSSANQKGTGGPSYFTYILKGNGPEQWQPQFTYYGFRYLQVALTSSSDQLPVIEAIKGLHIRNAAATVGNFTSSNQLFNQTNELINWAIRSNTVSVFTDCPHREKLGWLEETHLVGSSVQFNFDIANLCKKVIRDMMKAQTADGLIPEISPEYVQFEDPFRDSPEWGSAAILLPWYNYQWYGDKNTLRESYDMMKRYIAYLQKKSVNNILSHGLGDWYDIGPNRPGVSQLTPPGVTATAIYYYDLILMVNIAGLLGRSADIQQYRQQAAAVKRSFNERFFNKETKQYATASQAANAMALYMDLVEPADRKAVVDNLVKDIKDRNNALTAGDIGYRYLLRALEDAGRSDVIFDMNSRTDVPGYGYQLAHGATALTESWQAYPSVSNNHFMLGHLMEWFYAGLCGIKAAHEAGRYRIDIKPQPVGDVTNAAASYHSPYGEIKASWTRNGHSFQLNVSIPANTSATVYLPDNTTYTTPVKIGSGSYTYTVQLK